MTGMPSSRAVRVGAAPWGVLLCVALAELVVATPAEAQQGMQDCEWLPPSGTLRRETLGPGGTNAIFRVNTPRVVCAGGIEIQARDSAPE